MTYPILPSLSRAPSFKSTRSVGKGATIADPMESGYVATRPRFTRQRRMFGVTYDFLTPEDLRVLDQFECLTVQGEAGAFYMPNLLPNGSFENPDLLGGLYGWTPGGSNAWAIGTSAVAADGDTAVSFVTSAAPSATAWITSNNPIHVTVGDVYQVTASASLACNYSAAVQIVFHLQISYADGTTYDVYEPDISAVTSGYQAISTIFTIPASTAGATSAIATAQFMAILAAGTTPGAVVSGSPLATILLDQVALALISPVQAYGRMPGSSPLGSLVRFTKTPSLKDAGWAGGTKRYSCSFEVTEV